MKNSIDQINYFFILSGIVLQIVSFLFQSLSRLLVCLSSFYFRILHTLIEVFFCNINSVIRWNIRILLAFFILLFQCIFYILDSFQLFVQFLFQTFSDSFLFLFWHNNRNNVGWEEILFEFWFFDNNFNFLLKLFFRDFCCIVCFLLNFCGFCFFLFHVLFGFE